MLFDTGLSDIFFGYLSSDKGNKSKNKQMGLHKLKTFAQQKEVSMKQKGSLLNGR